MLQIVPYYMTGFESIVKGSEEARPGYDTRGFSRAILLALLAGALFYVTVVAVVAFIVPWREIVDGQLGTEAAFERAFGSRTIAQLILFGAFLSLLKVFNGNFVASTRLILAVGRRGLVHPSLAKVHPQVRNADGRGGGDGSAHRRGVVPGRCAAGAGERGGLARGRRRLDGGLCRVPGLDPAKRRGRRGATDRPRAWPAWASWWAPASS